MRDELLLYLRDVEMDGHRYIHVIVHVPTHVDGRSMPSIGCSHLIVTFATISEVADI
jgi:hypothetical protein